MQTERDLRIDLVRGLCLLVIYSRHVRPNVLGDFMPSTIGFSDAAEVFVLLSGLVCGRAYKKAIQNGFLFCQVKALRRCGEIYLAHIFTLFLGLALIPLLVGELNAKGARFFDDPGLGVQRVLLLSFFPYSSNVLALYVALLVPLPIMLWISRRFGISTMLFLSFLLYIEVQFFPQIKPSGAWARVGFNPFAWQFLFFIGVGWGTDSSGEYRPPRNNLLFAAASAGLLALFVLKLSYASGENAWRLPAGSLPWGKPSLGPLRLVHFGLLAYLCWAVLPPANSSFYRGRAATTVIRSGQNSLALFCLGVFLANLANELLRTQGSSLWLQIAANIGGWILLLLFGSVLATMTRHAPAYPERPVLSVSTSNGTEVLDAAAQTGSGLG